MSVIGFYHEYEDHGWLSNWYPAKCRCDGMKFSSSEQYFMYRKVTRFGRNDLGARIMKAEDPAECKQIAGKPFPEFDSKVWDRESFRIMYDGVRAKFEQNPVLCSFLLDTKDSVLAEMSPRDRHWGTGLSEEYGCDIPRWRGRNLLGMVLMDVRADIRRDDGKVRWKKISDKEFREYILSHFQGKEKKEIDSTWTCREEADNRKLAAGIPGYVDMKRRLDYYGEPYFDKDYVEQILKPEYRKNIIDRLVYSYMENAGFGIRQYLKSELMYAANEQERWQLRSVMLQEK